MPKACSVFDELARQLGMAATTWRVAAMAKAACSGG